MDKKYQVMRDNKENNSHRSPFLQRERERDAHSGLHFERGVFATDPSAQLAHVLGMGREGM